MSAVSVEDLFAAGIGFDLAGAVLIGKSVLADKASLALAPTFDGIRVRGYVMVRERVDAEFGAGLLVVGFLLQLVGYIALLEGLHAGDGDVAALTALLAAVVGLAIGVLAWFLLKRATPPPPARLDRAEATSGDCTHQRGARRSPAGLGRRVISRRDRDGSAPRGQTRRRGRRADVVIPGGDMTGKAWVPIPCFGPAGHAVSMATSPRK
jgi:hypothetical protein